MPGACVPSHHLVPPLSRGRVWRGEGMMLERVHEEGGPPDTMVRTFLPLLPWEWEWEWEGEGERERHRDTPVSRWASLEF